MTGTAARSSDGEPNSTEFRIFATVCAFCENGPGEDELR